MRETVGWARELMGGNGILLEHHVGRFVADAEAIYSYEGTREMNTLIVGRAITGAERVRRALAGRHTLWSPSRPEGMTSRGASYDVIAPAARTYDVRQAGDATHSLTSPVTSRTSSPSSSEATRSTVAVIRQSWSPSGSPRICWTSQAALTLLDQQHLRTPRVRAGVDRVVLGEVVRERLPPVLGDHRRAGLGLELAELLPAVQRGQLHPAEHRVAHQHGEGTLVGGDALRHRRQRRRGRPAASRSGR